MRNKLFYELGNFARLSFCCFSKLPCFRPYLPKIRLRKGKTFRAGLKKDKSNPAPPPPHPLKNLLSVTKVFFFWMFPYIQIMKLYFSLLWFLIPQNDTFL